MDGELPSLYPYSSKRKTFTLTHSKYTHIKNFKTYEKLSKFKKNISKKQVNSIRKKMEKDFGYYYKNFKKKNFCIRVIFYHTKLFQKKLLLKDRYLLKEIKILYHYFPQK